MTRPVIYQINTATFLFGLSQHFHEPVTLATVPDETWDKIAAMHINTVWLMGIWQRSETSAQMARGHAWVEAALPGADDDDVIGSAYSIQSYTVDERWGGNDELAIARAKLKERGISLFLDYVPNHVAIDHPWTLDHPDYFLEGTEQELRDQPDAFKRVGDHIYANGKDPHFAPWSDVLQLSAFSPGLRAETTSTLQTIATMCDGVRCDMAMLMMNDVFSKTWIGYVPKAPETEFWPPIISAVKNTNPDFLFTAEVYWDREEALLQEGFDFCYDKPLFDALLKGSARAVRESLDHTAGIQKHLLSFIENHDEEPAASTMPWPQHQAAAVIIATLPGAVLYHEVQWDGFTRHIPVQLRRRVPEQKNDSVRRFYRDLLNATADLKGEWRRVEIHKSLFSGANMLAWEWDNRFIVVNFGNRRTHANVETSLAYEPRFGHMKKKGPRIELEPFGFAVIDKL